VSFANCLHVGAEQEVDGNVLLKLDADLLRSEFGDVTLNSRILLDDAIKSKCPSSFLALLSHSACPSEHLLGLNVASVDVHPRQDNICHFGHSPTETRNLVVCIDGTLNQFGDKVSPFLIERVCDSFCFRTPTLSSCTEI